MRGESTPKPWLAARASPESFRRTRLKIGSGISPTYYRVSAPARISAHRAEYFRIYSIRLQEGGILKLALVLVMFTICGSYAFGQSESEVRNRLVGTWKLVSTEETLKDGTTRPSLGPHGQGFLMYQSDGYMCANLVNPDRPKWADPVHTTPEEKIAAADGTFAYCGRYEIDAKQKQIIHLPEVATDPGYVGSRQVRPYVFEGGRLVLSDIEKEDPSVARWKIVWEKAQ